MILFKLVVNNTYISLHAYSFFNNFPKHLFLNIMEAYSRVRTLIQLLIASFNKNFDLSKIAEETRRQSELKRLESSYRLTKNFSLEVICKIVIKKI